MWCLVPGAAVGKSLCAHVIYRGWREGRKGYMFSRKEFLFLSRFSFCRLLGKKKRERERHFETDFSKCEIISLLFNTLKKNSNPCVCNAKSQVMQVPQTWALATVHSPYYPPVLGRCFWIALSYKSNRVGRIFFFPVKSASLLVCSYPRSMEIHQGCLLNESRTTCDSGTRAVVSPWEKKMCWQSVPLKVKTRDKEYFERIAAPLWRFAHTSPASHSKTDTTFQCGTSSKTLILFFPP